MKKRQQVPAPENKSVNLKSINMSTQVANVNQNGNQKPTLMQVIEQATPEQLVARPEIANRFKHLFSIIHPGNKNKAEIFYEAEKFHFIKRMNDNRKLNDCSKLSLYGCFMDVAVNGLSFDPTFKHLYLIPRSFNVGTKNAPNYELRCCLDISGYGELVLRKMQGQIKHADNPVLVYEGDDFSFGTKDGKFFLEHVSNLSKRTKKILACYLRITRNDGTVDYKVITQEDMERYRKSSQDPNSKAWTDSIGGMWQAKCIKHAFSNYPKMRIGEFSQLASDTVDQLPESVETVETVPAPGAPAMQIPENIDYGTEIVEAPAGVKANNTPVTLDPVDDEAFVKPGATNGATKTVSIDNDDF